ncbi:hypothetical protein V8F20_008057 [Naviculisporaceae sp. PSN 640]
MAGYNDSEDGSLWQWCRDNAFYINHTRPGSNDTLIKFDAKRFDIHQVTAMFHRSARWRDRVFIEAPMARALEAVRTGRATGSVTRNQVVSTVDHLPVLWI